MPGKAKTTVPSSGLRSTPAPAAALRAASIPTSRLLGAIGRVTSYDPKKSSLANWNQPSALSRKYRAIELGLNSTRSITSAMFGCGVDGSVRRR